MTIVVIGITIGLIGVVFAVRLLQPLFAGTTVDIGPNHDPWIFAAMSLVLGIASLAQLSQLR